jgi:hypothetical protein
MRELKKIQSSRVAPARRKVPNRNILTRPPRRTLTSDEARKLAGDGLGAERIAFFQRKSSAFIDELSLPEARRLPGKQVAKKENGSTEPYDIRRTRLALGL